MVTYGTEKELDSWMELVNQVSWNFPGLETEEALAEHRATVRRFMKERRALCVRDGETVVGVLLFSIKRNMICCLAVHPDHRRRGIASALLTEALRNLDRAREITVSTFRADDEKGKAPRALYKKFGFAEGELIEEFGYPNQRFVLKASAGKNRSDAGALSHHAMTEEERATVSEWRYEGRYAVYNLPPYAEQKEKQSGLGNPELAENYHAYYDEGRLIAYTSIRKRKEGVFIGIGVAPEWCGKGYGPRVLEMAVRIAGERYPAEPVCLIVREWNQRAIRCYEKAGFTAVGEPFAQETPPGVFLKMVYRA